MGKMTLNDLNTILSQSVDTSTNDSIYTDLKTSIINQDLSNSDLIPSIQNAILLKNKYEVLKIDKDFNGTLESLMKQQGKKIPSKLPFVNILLVGGGSSGGWIYGGTTNVSKDTWNSDNDYWVGSGVAGEICSYPCFKYLNLNTVLDIHIGKGGQSKASKIWEESEIENKDAELIPNEGSSSYIRWYEKSGETLELRARGGYETYIEESSIETKVGGLSTIIPPDENNYYTIATPCSFIGMPSYQSVSHYNLYNEYDLYSNYNSKDYNLYYNNKCFNPTLFPIQYFTYKYIGNIGINICVLHMDWHLGNSSNASKLHTYRYLIKNSCPTDDLSYIKTYLENIRTSLINRPKKVNDEDSEKRFTYNKYGVYQNNPGRWDRYKNYDCIFFDGLDANNYGMSGLSGSYAEWNPRNADDELTTYYQRGYMGKGGDGVCYIYYPKEV